MNYSPRQFSLLSPACCFFLAKAKLQTFTTMNRVVNIVVRRVMTRASMDEIERYSNSNIRVLAVLVGWAMIILTSTVILDLFCAVI